jgi:hypothetical protein
MTLTDDQRAAVETLAGLFYTPEQVAIIQELPIEEVKTAMALQGSDFFRAYWKGYYQAEVEFRTKVKNLSNLGSSPAQNL